MAIRKCPQSRAARWVPLFRMRRLSSPTLVGSDAIVVRIPNPMRIAARIVHCQIWCNPFGGWGSHSRASSPYRGPGADVELHLRKPLPEQYAGSPAVETRHSATYRPTADDPMAHVRQALASRPGLAHYREAPVVFAASEVVCLLWVREMCLGCRSAPGWSGLTSSPLTSP